MIQTIVEKRVCFSLPCLGIFSDLGYVVEGRESHEQAGDEDI